MIAPNRHANRRPSDCRPGRANQGVHRGLCRVALPIALALTVVVTAAGCDITVKVPLTCNIVGSLFTQRIRTVTSPDDVPRGGTVHVDLTVHWIDGRSEGTVRQVELTLPLPVDLASIDDVTFVGTDLAGSWTVAGRQLVLTFTGAASELTVEVPTARITGTVAPDARTGPLPWRTVSATTYWADHPDGPFQSRCVPTDPSTLLTNTNVI